MTKNVLKEARNEIPRNNTASTPLHFAAMHGHLKIFQIVLKHFKNEYPKTIFGESPLYFAALNPLSTRGGGGFPPPSEKIGFSTPIFSNFFKRNLGKKSLRILT